MKIKSLLLGSAAAMFAASGASAADAIIAAEPEPVEYVRVCDAFGNGYFYIPGTETCLRISGYVWFQVGATDVSYDSSIGDTWENSTRARVNIDARSDTEWGELASRIRLQGTWGNNVDGPDLIDQAWIRLGGLFMGYSESYWVDAYNTGPTNFGSHSWDGMGYGYQQRHQIGYTFNTGNFYIAASVEDNSQVEVNGGSLSPSWTPNFVGKIGGQLGPVNIFAKAGYDALTGNAGYGAGLVTDVGSAGNFILYGYWAPDGTTDYGGNKSFRSVSGTQTCFGGVVFNTLSDCQVTPEWSVLGSFRWQFTPTFSASIGGQYFGDFYFPTSFGPAFWDQSTGIDAWQAELELVWTPVTDFEIRAYIQYFDADNFGDTTTGFLRFTRSF